MAFSREQANLAYVSSRAISYDVRIRWFCGGAHPNYYLDFITIDFRDGHRIDWTRAIVNRRAISTFYWANSERLRGKQRADCDANVFKNEADNNYEFVSGGLLIYPELPEMVWGCAVDIVMPSARARPLLVPHLRPLLPT